MKPNELRIGNYVILKGQLSFIDIPLTLSFAEEMQPVQITPDILEGCRFNSSFTCLYGLASAENIYYLTVEDQSTGTRIEYLHQLQNLYFALTGEELIINL